MSSASICFRRGFVLAAATMAFGAILALSGPAVDPFADATPPERRGFESEPRPSWRGREATLLYSALLEGMGLSGLRAETPRESLWNFSPEQAPPCSTQGAETTAPWVPAFMPGSRGVDEEIMAVSFNSSGPLADGWHWLMDPDRNQTAEWSFDRIPQEQDITVRLEVLARSNMRMASGVNVEFFLSYGAAAPDEKEALFFGRIKVVLPNIPTPGNPDGRVCRGTVVIPRKELRGSQTLILKAGRSDELGQYPPVDLLIGVRAESAVLLARTHGEPEPKPKPRDLPEPEPKLKPRPIPIPKPEPVLRPFAGDHLPETDLRDQAFVLGPGEYFGELGHEREGGGHDNVDWYAVNPHPGEIVKVTLDMKEGRNFNLALVSPFGNPLETSAHQSDATDAVEWAAGREGTAFIKISRAAGQGRYALAVDIRHQDDGGSGRDAGSDQSGAVPVYPAGEPADGQLLPDDNIDFYSIALEKGWTLYVKLLVQSGRNFNLALLKPDGTLVEASKGGAGESESIEFTAPSAKTYFLRIIRKSGEGHYQLQLSIHK